MKMFAAAVLSIALIAPCAAESALGTLLTGTAAQKGFSVPEVPPVTPPQAREDYEGVMDLAAPQAEILVEAAREDGYAVLELNGASMTTKRALMAHAAQQLRLPVVPENWDALIDQLSDLPVIHNNKDILIVVRNASRIARTDAQLYADLREVAEFSAKSAREWGRGSVHLTFVFVN